MMDQEQQQQQQQQQPPAGAVIIGTTIDEEEEYDPNNDDTAVAGGDLSMNLDSQNSIHHEEVFVQTASSATTNETTTTTTTTTNQDGGVIYPRQPPPSSSMLYDSTTSMITMTAHNGVSSAPTHQLPIEDAPTVISINNNDDMISTKSPQSVLISNQEDFGYSVRTVAKGMIIKGPSDEEDFLMTRRNSQNGGGGSSAGGANRRRPSMAQSIGSAKTRESFSSKATKETRRTSMTMGDFWNRLQKKSDVWEEMSDLGDDDDDYLEKEPFYKKCRVYTKNGCESLSRWLKATLKTAVHTPSVWIPCVLLFVFIVTCGLLVVHGFDMAETNARQQNAAAVAEQTDLFFVRVLENAFVPLFTMAQFVKELPEFHSLDLRIGDRCDPVVDPYNCTQSTSVPVLEGKEQTHRNVSKLFNDTEDGRVIQKKFDSIASGIKANAGLGKSLVSIQLAPKGVVSMIYPMINCMDFEDGYCMNNTGAWGHDLLNDPNRKAIAQATVPADGVVTAGPLKLIQGEDTFIARIAINFPLEEDNLDGKHSMVIDGVDYPCWGFAVVLLNWKTLKEESNIYKEFESNHMQFMLTRTDIKDGVEQVVTIANSSRPELIQNDNITLALDTGDNGWVIAVGYDDGFSPNYKKWAYPLVFVCAFMFSILMMLVLVSKQEYEHILHNLMPKRAIKKLAKGKTVVDRFTNVTIFFSDIAGYTKMSSDMTPIEVMTMLNGLFSKFDALAKKHGVFKVETIGDAYIAIAGAPNRCSGPQAAEKITLFALDALKAVKEHTTQDGAQIAIRAGLASGPVVAGVLGESLPKYTLFGDTVNFAARMEQTGQKGRLQICPTTHQFLVDAPHYHFHREERRDEKGELGVECKGKGRQYTYWVNSVTKLEDWCPDHGHEITSRRDTALVGDISSSDDEPKSNTRVVVEPMTTAEEKV